MCLGFVGAAYGQDMSDELRSTFNAAPESSPFSDIGPDASTNAPSASASIFNSPDADADNFAPVPAPAGLSASAKKRLRAGSSTAPALTVAPPLVPKQNPPELAVSPESVSAIAALSQAEINAENERLYRGRGEREQSLDGRPKTYEEQPYRQVGLRLGSFQAYPQLEQGLTATNNARSSNQGRSALMSETALRLNAISDWSRHEARIDAYGVARKTLSGEKIDDVRANFNGALRLDLSGGYIGKASAFYSISPESATSPITIEGSLDEPIRHVFGGSLGLEKSLGPVELDGSARIEREIYGDASLSTGGTLSQSDRNSTYAAFTLRTGYEISAALTPFVEGEIGRRYFDERRDSGGFERSSLRSAMRAGLEVDLGEKFSGEFSGGYTVENFDDSRLKNLAGASLAADFRWSPMRGTLLGLNASSILEGSTTPGTSGSILYATALIAERQMRANLTGTAALTIGWRDYKGTDGHDLILGAEAGLTYWLNRYVGLQGRTRYEQVKSNLPYRDSDTASIYLGLKLQR